MASLGKQTTDEKQMQTVRYVKYHGNVYINGFLAPIGTEIRASAGGSTVVVTPGYYTLTSLDIGNIEFYVNGIMATSQIRLYAPYERQIDLFVVSAENAIARCQKYTRRQKRKSPKPKKKK